MIICKLENYRKCEQCARTVGKFSNMETIREGQVGMLK